MDESKHEAKSARQTQKIDNGIEAQRKVFSIAPVSWQMLSDKMNAKSLLSPKELGILAIASKMPSKIPSEAQSRVLLGILEKGKEEGFQVPDMIN
ncbi:MAG: hypothetical protein Q7T25_08635 [Sideroxyarcus sp.]|nr:hypothetical protein [Sideroxyarcus sp.]